MLGISSSGSPIAGIIFPIIFSQLEPVIGFGWATRVIAFILLGISVIPLIFMHTRIPPTGKIRSLYDRAAFRDMPFMVFVGGAFFGFLALYVPFFYITVFADAHGLWTPELTPYLVTLLNAGSVFGRIVPNAIADRWGSVNMIILCAASSAILAFGWLGIHNLPGLIVFSLLYGLFSGGVVSLLPSVIVAYSPNMGQLGARMGVSFMMCGISLLIGTPIAGAILGDFAEEKWLGTIGYAGACTVLASILFVISRVMRYRQKPDLKL